LGAALTPQESDLPEIRPWSAATEAASICDKDVGEMPLRDMSWTRGECGDTLIQDRACGLPVVALPVGVNAEIVEHGVKGFLARTEAGWRTAIETLLKDPDLRARMGAAGRRKLEERYSLQLWGPRVVEMRRRVAG
jgi:glycosyltransferase involved in cell wall biosynthesis